MGRIFWTGADRYTGGKRYGLKGPGGETFWVSGADLAPAEGGPAPVPIDTAGEVPAAG